jgi:hypothetical protein
MFRSRVLAASKTRAKSVLVHPISPHEVTEAQVKAGLVYKLVTDFKDLSKYKQLLHLSMPPFSSS